MLLPLCLPLFLSCTTKRKIKKKTLHLPPRISYPTFESPFTNTQVHHRPLTTPPCPPPPLPPVPLRLHPKPTTPLIPLQLVANPLITNGQNLAPRPAIRGPVHKNIITISGAPHHEVGQIVEGGAGRRPDGAGLPPRPSRVDLARRVHGYVHVPFEFEDGGGAGRWIRGSWGNGGGLAAEVGEEVAGVVEDVLACLFLAVNRRGSLVKWRGEARVT